MTPRRRRGLRDQDHRTLAARRRSAAGGGGVRRHRSSSPGLFGSAGSTRQSGGGGQAAEALAELQANDLWERHGAAAYALARALLGNDVAAAKAVELGMTHVAGSGEGASPNDVRRALARHVYTHSRELSDETAWTLRLPASMVWLGQLAELQRACLALCVFGGHTHREAAALIGVSPATVARSLTSGLRELGVLSTGDGPATATG